MPPVTDKDDGVASLVWCEDDATIGIATADSLQFADTLVAAANHCDPRADYD
jgi:hypothetical protein